MISSLSIFSLNSRWMALVARKTWIRARSACLTASHARSMSSWRQRASPQITDPRTARAISRTDSKSPGEAMGKPASITSTPNSTRAWAISIFSARFMLQPGDCSPSRSVVSKITMCREEESAMFCAILLCYGPTEFVTCGERTGCRPLVGAGNTNQALVGPDRRLPFTSTRSTALLARTKKPQGFRHLEVRQIWSNNRQANPRLPL